MFKRPKLSLRASYIITIAILTVAPAWILSTFLIDRFEQIFTTNLEEKLGERAKRLGSELDQELDLLTIQLQQAATDLDLSLAVHTGAYGNKIGHNKLQAIMQHHSMLSSLLLIDKNLQVIEAVPENSLLLELNTAEKWLQLQLKNNRNNNTTANIINAPKLLEQLSHFGAQQARTNWQKTHKKPLENKYILLIFVPLRLSQDDASSDINTTVGGLLGLIPMQYLFDQLKYSALPTTLLSGTLMGETLYDVSPSMQEELLRIQHAISIPGLSAPIKLQFSERKATLSSALDPLASDFTNVTLISLAIIMVLALVITRLLLQPFNLLARIVTIYAKGNYQPITTHTRFRELQHIITVLAQMAKRIKHNHRELELRVEERTSALKESNKELSETMKQLKNMQSQLVEVEKMSQLGQLVAGVAHEINTPVGVALTAASMDLSSFESLKEKLDNNQIKKSDLEQHIASGTEASQMVIRNLKRAVELISNFKEVAVDQSSEQRRCFNLSSYINEVLGSLKAELRRFDIKLNVTGNYDIELESYPGVFAQIISNFVMNSLNHGFEVGKSYSINIEFQQLGENIQLTYQDTGKGVDPENLSKLFTPFFTTARGQGGTGLGLHIVYNLVSMKLGGSIQAFSEPNKGMRFDMMFPIKAPRNPSA